MKRIAALLLSLVVMPLAAWADPPGRVGRLAYVEGAVSVFADPAEGWQPARINTHITGENSVWTEPGARAEVRIGPIALRLGEATQLDLARLDDLALEAHVPQGSVAVNLRELDSGESVTFTTPGARFQLRGNGRYRIDAGSERGESRLTVLSGNARLEVAGGYVSVDTGRSIVVAEGGRSSFELLPASATALDDWSIARDERYAQREAARYVSPYVTGWEDLDDHGVWRTEPEFGPVWYPTQVAVGWAPYRYGRWTWVRPWGWAWVDDAPWGYAPFHYGRWVYVGNRWGWYPGRYVGRPVWAPALVGWVGQPGWSVTISGGPANVVGWYPLSPYERYQPWYAANVTYVNRVNHIVIVERRDRRGEHERDRPGWHEVNRQHGATVVTRANFVSHRPVQGAQAPVPPAVLATQPVVSGSVVLPSRNERPTARPSEAPRAPGAAPASPRYPAGRLEPTPPSVNLVPAPAQPLEKPVARPAPPMEKPVTRPAPPMEKPAPRAAQPQERPAPAPRATQPLEKPASVPRTTPPQETPVPAPRATQPMERPVPAPAVPVAKPVPQQAPSAAAPMAAPTHPQAKPAPAPERPIAKPAAGAVQPGEIPAKP